MRKLKAQQITEFMLATPILIAFFIILTEFAFAFNAYTVLNNATASSFPEIITNISIETTSTTYRTAVKNHVLNDLTKNKLPNPSSANTDLITVNNYAAVISTYTYTPDFNYAFLPALRSINLSSISIFPFEIPNNIKYKDGLTTAQVEAEIAPLPPPPPPPTITDEEEDDDETDLEKENVGETIE